MLATFLRTTDIREIIMKDCMSIWQKATIRDALPEINKNRKQHKWASGQATEFDTDENRDRVRNSNPAEPSSLAQ